MKHYTLTLLCLLILPTARIISEEANTNSSKHITNNQKEDGAPKITIKRTLATLPDHVIRAYLKKIALRLKNALTETSDNQTAQEIFALVRDMPYKLNKKVQYFAKEPLRNIVQLECLICSALSTWIERQKSREAMKDNDDASHKIDELSKAQKLLQNEYQHYGLGRPHIVAEIMTQKYRHLRV